MLAQFHFQTHWPWKSFVVSRISYSPWEIPEKIIRSQPGLAGGFGIAIFPMLAICAALTFCTCATVSPNRTLIAPSKRRSLLRRIHKSIIPRMMASTVICLTINQHARNSHATSDLRRLEALLDCNCSRSAAISAVILTRACSTRFRHLWSDGD
jgi:hypothetical protein